MAGGPASREHRYVDSWVTPIQSGPRYARAVGRRTLIGARLEPWAAVALFGPLPRGDGAPPPRLRQHIGVEASRLRARLIDAPNDAERFRRFTAWLQDQPSLRVEGTKIDPRAAGASVSALARAMRLTPRSMRRRFALDAGLSPKGWLTLHRLDAVLRDPALGDRDQPLAAFAAAHGYADQAHFSREIVRLTGVTPGLLRRRLQPSPPHLLAHD